MDEQLTKMKLEIVSIYRDSLKARRDTASNFTLNQDMQIECRLLDAQIEVLEREIEDIRSAHNCSHDKTCVL